MIGARVVYQAWQELCLVRVGVPWLSWPVRYLEKLQWRAVITCHWLLFTSCWNLFFFEWNFGSNWLKWKKLTKKNYYKGVFHHPFYTFPFRTSSFVLLPRSQYPHFHNILLVHPTYAMYKSEGRQFSNIQHPSLQQLKYTTPLCTNPTYKYYLYTSIWEKKISYTHCTLHTACCTLHAAPPLHHVWGVGLPSVLNRKVSSSFRAPI